MRLVPPPQPHLKAPSSMLNLLASIIMFVPNLIGAIAAGMASLLVGPLRLDS